MQVQYAPSSHVHPTPYTVNAKGGASPVGAAAATSGLGFGPRKSGPQGGPGKRPARGAAAPRRGPRGPDGLQGYGSSDAKTAGDSAEGEAVPVSDRVAGEGDIEESGVDAEVTTGDAVCDDNNDDSEGDNYSDEQGHSNHTSSGEQGDAKEMVSTDDGVLEDGQVAGSAVDGNNGAPVAGVC